MFREFWIVFRISPNLNQYSIAAAQPGLAVDRVLNLYLPVPPPEEQAAIATSIELQTASIDTAIDNTRRQIELMEEYRTRLISDVVTGKIDVREAAAQLPDVDGWNPIEKHLLAGVTYQEPCDSDTGKA